MDATPPFIWEHSPPLILFFVHWTGTALFYCPKLHLRSREADGGAQLIV